MAEENKIASLIHVGKMGRKYLFLRKLTTDQYEWFMQDDNGSETATALKASNAEEAMRLANRTWREEGFHMLNCGFRYTLPERDEHGSNALFHQMAASYASSNGIYFDEELGGNCIIHNASSEARTLWKSLLKSDEKAH